MLQNRSGISRAAVIIYITVSAVIIYAVIKTVPPFMDYYSMDDEVADELHLSTINPDNVITGDLTHKIKELGLPVQPDDFKVERRPDGTLAVDIKWTVTVDYGYGFKREFPFEIHADNSKHKD